MAEKIGVVIDSDLDGWARVLTDRSGGCGGCHAGTSGCRSCLTGAKLESRAANAVGARSGDIVKLALPATTVFKGAALLYLLPVVSLIGGAFLGHWLGNLFAWPGSAGAVGGSLAGLAAALWVVVRMGRSNHLVRQMTPVITTVLQRSGTTAVWPQPGTCCR